MFSRAYRAAVTVPPQVVDAFGVAATTRPDGNVSVRSDCSVAAVATGLLNVIVSVLGVGETTVVGENDFDTLGVVPAGPWTARIISAR